MMSIVDMIKLQSCVLFHYYVYYNDFVSYFCDMYIISGVHYLSLFPCNKSSSHVVFDKITF